MSRLGKVSGRGPAETQAEPALVCSTGGILQNEDENAAVRVKLPSGGRLGREERVGRSDMRALNDEAGARQSVVHIFALAIDGRIDLVREAVVALVALEANVVRGGDAPHGTAVRFVRQISTHEDDCAIRPPLTGSPCAKP